MQKSVMLVEDDADIRELLQEYLEGDGYTVLAARHGQQALEILSGEAAAPGLILLDRHMEVMDGKEFLDALIADPKLAALSIPVVLMSAAGEVDETRVTAFLRKPFNFNELLKVVGKYCV